MVGLINRIWGSTMALKGCRWQLNKYPARVAGQNGGKIVGSPDTTLLALLRQQNVAGSGMFRDTTFQSFSFHIFLFFFI